MKDSIWGNVCCSPSFRCCHPLDMIFESSLRAEDYYFTNWCWESDILWWLFAAELGISWSRKMCLQPSVKRQRAKRWRSVISEPRFLTGHPALLLQSSLLVSLFVHPPCLTLCPFLTSPLPFPSFCISASPSVDVTFFFFVIFLSSHSLFLSFFKCLLPTFSPSQPPLWVPQLFSRTSLQTGKQSRGSPITI